jgi:hypothetical protein
MIAMELATSRAHSWRVQAARSSLVLGAMMDARRRGDPCMGRALDAR